MLILLACGSSLLETLDLWGGEKASPYCGFIILYFPGYNRQKHYGATEVHNILFRVFFICVMCPALAAAESSRILTAGSNFMVSLFPR